MTRIELAKLFAHEAHDSIGQKRKYSGEPYWVHTDAVAEEAAKFVAYPNYEDMVIAAHLHDISEDIEPQRVTIPNPERFGLDTDIDWIYGLNAIAAIFGAGVAHLVLELTDEYTKEKYPEKNRAERKRLERERIGKTSPNAQTIKLADLIHNSESIIKEDPDFAKVYLPEKLAMLGELVKGDSTLLARASQLTLEGYVKIGLKIPVLYG